GIVAISRVEAVDSVVGPGEIHPRVAVEPGQEAKSELYAGLDDFLYSGRARARIAAGGHDIDERGTHGSTGDSEGASGEGLVRIERDRGIEGSGHDVAEVTGLARRGRARGAIGVAEIAQCLVNPSLGDAQSSRLLLAIDSQLRVEDRQVKDRHADQG